MSTSQRPSRPITDELRQTVVDDLPEVSLIQNEDLHNKVVEAWAYALAESSFDRITSLPAEGNPGVFRMKRGTQADHLRGVTRVAMAIAAEFQTAFPETDIDRDVVIAGGLVHDPRGARETDMDAVDRVPKRRQTCARRIAGPFVPIDGIKLPGQKLRQIETALNMSQFLLSTSSNRS
ncbi:hypothetical protein [Bradyrhizobium sp. JYMT SZCCT0428]|uniref:hypothetical protein n=1 Tax=Bradyrhizobium sp. JYMT SZCCT0428 TaxID=2807673 RepID=UPI001BADEF10|nr:hypothetical protein [Bradyrhizobium sp. JYMT SZCCT0428]MBR1149627.1 hypothetical protein [Bradyrhizobium sp. JYMT SZCCT0428]